MIKIFNNVIPFKGFVAMTVWPFLFIRKEFKRYEMPFVFNHESIHARQQIELLIIGFYLVYLAEWVIGILKGQTSNEAYRNISFEREAYENEYDLDYLKSRKCFSQWRRK